MTQTYPISVSQRRMILEAATKAQMAQAALNGLYTIILAQFDLEGNYSVDLTDEGLVVTPKDEGAT